VAATVALYLGLAAAIYAAWCLAPVLALGAFLIIASIHFAEDWSDRLPPFFAIGMAVALLTTPALLHHRELTDIFAALTGQENAATVADLSLLVAPVALVAAAVGLWLLIRSGQWTRALETAAALAAMVLLPPVAGFAVFFCLSHSPRHFAAARAEVGSRDGEAALLSCAALGIAVLIYATRGAAPLGDKAIFASFVTLSVLTVPHMIVPQIMNRQRGVKLD
jgi:Brp/Blh family beta-carotene 15,15'-monooxygenase